MRSTDSLRLQVRRRISVLLILALAGGRATLASDSPKVVLRAAAAQGKSGIEVRLRWSLTDGWLPDGGFNLYRSDRSAPLNPTPLSAAASVGSNAQIDIGTSHSFQLGKLLSKARQTSASTLPPLALQLPQTTSSEADFNQLAARTAPTPATPAETVTGSTSTAHMAPSFAAHPVLKLPTAPATQAEVTLASRRALLLGAALHRGVSTALGLSFDDPNVTPGQTYTYTLRPISNGAEGAPVATVTVVVPTDASGLKPQAPAGLRAIQTGPDTVALRWKRLSPQTEAEMGVAKYDVFRMREGTKLQKLNSVPVLVVNVGIPDATGTVTNLQEPKAFFTDTAPVLGRVEYQIVLTDIFDRSSDPAPVLVTVADLHPPREVPFAAAQLQVVPALATRKTYRRTRPFNITSKPAPSQPVLIAWQPSPDAGVAYRVYRADIEQPSQPAQLLTATPVAGTATAAASLPAGSIPDALAAEACSRMAHAGTLSGLVFSQNSGQSLNPSRHSFINISSCNLNQLSASDRSQVEQALLSSTQVLTWTDISAQKDHYYRYYVAPVFNRNTQQATPIQTNVVAYPDLTAPATPTGATATFQPAGSTPSSAEGRNSDATGTAGPTAKGNPAMQARNGRSLTLTDWSGPLVKAPPRDTGGIMALKWQAAPGAARYEVYRANITRVTLPANISRHQTAGSCSTSNANGQPSGGSQTGGASPQASGTTAAATTGAHLTVAAMPVCLGVPALASITWQVPPKDSDFVLLGTTRTTDYDDALSRSSAQYYQYRIVPVNRWNVPGAMATLDARAPATQPPSPPKLLVGSPSPDGGAQIEFLPNADPGEEVIRYELWRSTLLPGASSEPSSSSGASNTVQAPAPTAHMVHSSTSSSSNTTPQASGLSGATSSLTANKLQRIAIGPATAQLAGSAARYGVTLHQPVMAAVSRTGASMAASIQTSLLQGHMVAQINSTDLPTGSNTGAWLTDAPAGLDWRRDYAYVVKAIDKDGLESVSEPVDLTPLKVKAGPPANVTATLNARTCAVDVAWQSTEPATAGFVVERQLLTRAGSASTAGPSSSTGHAITAQGTNAAIASTYHPPGATTAFAVTQMNGPDYIQLSQMIPQTRYTDASVFPDNSYVYRVRTVDQAGNVSVPTAIPQNIAIPDGCGTTTALQESSSTLRTPQKGNTTESTQQSVASTAVPPEQSLASTSTQPPTFSANAAAASIPVNGVTTLSFHFQNTTSSPLTGLALTSQLPAGLVIALPNAVTNTCGGTASAPPWMNSITLSGAILAPNASCIVSVNVTGTSAGQKQVSASFSYSGASPVTSNGATITVLPASPKPGNPPNPQPQPNPPPTRKRVVAA